MVSPWNTPTGSLCIVYHLFTTGVCPKKQIEGKQKRKPNVAPLLLATHRAFSLPWDLRKFLSLCCDRNVTSSSSVLREGVTVRIGRKRGFKKVLWEIKS